MATEGTSDYLIAIYILLPMVVVLLLLACVHVVCSKQFKLNWYEKALLEENERRKPRCAGESVDSATRYCGYTVTCKRGENTNKRRAPLKAVVEVIKSLKRWSTRLKSSTDNSVDEDENGRRTQWIICSRKTMGSSPTSPEIEPVEPERFWVPANVVERKRAQSLVPTTSQHNDSEEEGSSGTVTPASLSGTREFTYSFPSTPQLSSSDGLPSPLPVSSRQRRASMQDAIDFRKIDSKLYDRRLLQRQQSVASIEEEQLGNINFNIDYNFETCLLTVYLIEADNLVSRDFSGTADPYCKVCLLPNRRTQLQSKIHRATTNPMFDEEFIFEVDQETLRSTTLELLLYDYDQFSRDECIGQVKIPFMNADFSQRQTLCKAINPKEQRKTKENDIGDLIFSLGYLSSAERLTVVVMKARNLKHSEDGKITMDPYVKVSLSCGSAKKTKKKKTSTKHNVFAPVWNEAVTFSLQKEHLQNVCLEFSVFHDNKMGNDEMLGQVKISRDSEGDERIHWDELVNCRSAVARWHPLTL